MLGIVAKHVPSPHVPSPSFIASSRANCQVYPILKTLNGNLRVACVLPVVVMLQLMGQVLPGVLITSIVDLRLEQSLSVLSLMGHYI